MKKSIAILSAVILLIMPISFSSFFDDAREFLGAVFSEPTGYATNDKTVTTTITGAGEVSINDNRYDIRIVGYGLDVATNEHYIYITVTNLNSDDTERGGIRTLETTRFLDLSLTMTKVTLSLSPIVDFNKFVAKFIITIPRTISLPVGYKLVSFAATKNDLDKLAAQCNPKDKYMKITDITTGEVIMDGSSASKGMQFGRVYWLWSYKCDLLVNTYPVELYSMTLSQGRNWIASPFEISQQQIENLCGTDNIERNVEYPPGGANAGEYLPVDRSDFKGGASYLDNRKLLYFQNQLRYTDKMIPYMGYLVQYKKDAPTCTITYKDIQRITTTTTTQAASGASGTNAPPVPAIPGMRFAIIAGDGKASIPVVPGINAIGIIEQDDTSHSKDIFNSGYLGMFTGNTKQVIEYAGDKLWGGSLYESVAGRDRDVPLNTVGVTLKDAASSNEITTKENSVIRRVIPVVFPATTAFSLTLPSVSTQYAVLRRGTNFFTSIVGLTKTDISTLLKSCIPGKDGEGTGTNIVPVEGASTNKPFAGINSDGKPYFTDTLQPYKAYFIGLETDASIVTSAGIAGAPTTDRDYNTGEDKMEDVTTVRKAAECPFYVVPSITASSATYKFCEAAACPDSKKVYLTKTV